MFYSEIRCFTGVMANLGSHLGNLRRNPTNQTPQPHLQGSLQSYLCKTKTVLVNMIGHCVLNLSPYGQHIFGIIFIKLTLHRCKHILLTTKPKEVKKNKTNSKSSVSFKCMYNREKFWNNEVRLGTKLTNIL